MTSVPPVFYHKLTLERQTSSQSIQAILGAILFHRALGNIQASHLTVHGVSLPVPVEPTLQRLIAAKTEECLAALSLGAPTRVVLTLYTTAQPTAPISVGGGATTPSTALGWFSAGAKALAGTGIVGGAGDDKDRREEVSEEAGEGVWEGWIVDFGLPTGRSRVGEERMRTQLEGFGRQLAAFVKEGTVPPITSAEVMPFAITIQINPTRVQFPIPKDLGRRAVA